MQGTASILRSKSFRWGFAFVAMVQLLCLLLATPMYEIDTNSFIRGGLTWDIYHNPLLNLYIAACTKIWANVWFIVGLQTVFYAGAVAFLATVLFGENGRLRWIALGLACLEPLTMFYNFSMLAESFFASFTVLSVAMLVLWLRHGRWQDAVLFGLMMGLTFMAKLSAMIHVPLFGLMLLRGGMAVPLRVRALAVAVLPFVACYIFVYVGQKIINEGDIYTVEGRVKWDFSSAIYDSTEAKDVNFARFVHPYLFREGKMVAHRELRRELTYLGYKDCVDEYERRGFAANRGINACDSIFGRVAQQIMQQHFWEAEKQFVADNFKFVHSLNYIDYRFTQGLHYYHPQKEYDYIDSLMAVTYHYDLAERAEKIPKVWRSLDFGNIYLPIVWWTWWIVLAAAGILWLRDRHRREVWVLGIVTAIPIISYRPRFLAPYLVLMLLLLVWEVNAFVRREK
jgi:hypothetical protein